MEHFFGYVALLSLIMCSLLSSLGRVYIPAELGER